MVIPPRHRRPRPQHHARPRAGERNCSPPGRTTSCTPSPTLCHRQPLRCQRETLVIGIKIRWVYLRARYYDLSNGRFNRLDPFAGNMGDSQSLHKYAYVHGDPVQGIDPSGLQFSVSGISSSIGAFTRGVASKLSSTVLGRKFALATVTALQNVVTGGIAFGLIAQNPIPDGIMVNVGFGTSGVSKGGLAGAASADIYFDIASRRLKLFFTGEAGIDPVSVQRKQFNRGSFNLTYGFVWNAEQPGAISGLSSVSTVPWPVLKNEHLLDPRLSLAKGLNPLLALLAKYNIGNIGSGGQIGQIALSTSGAVGLYYGRRSYQWAATAGITSPPIDLVSIRDLVDYGIVQPIDQIQELIESLASSVHSAV